MKKPNNGSPVVFYAGILLLCIVLVSSYMTNDLYARYATSSYGEDSARVAKFDVTYNVTIVNGEYSITELIDLGEIQPGGKSKSIQVSVTNQSEVAVVVKLYATNLTGNLPLNMPKAGDTTVEPIGTSSIIEPNGGKATISFNVTWQSGQTDPSYAGKTDIMELKVAVEQAD